MGINELREKVKSDKALAEQFKGLKTPEEAVEVAKKNGYDISVSDLERMAELSEEQLKAVAGGAGNPVDAADVIVYLGILVF